MRLTLVIVGALAIAGCGVAPVSNAQPSIEALPETSVAPTTSPTSTVALEVLADVPDVGDVLARMSADEVRELGGVDCATEIAHIVVAGERYFARTGVAAQTLEELVADIAVEPELWVLDDSAEGLVPAPGSPCTDVSAEQARRDVLNACRSNLKTLTTASEAFFALNGSAPLDKQQLLDEELIREPAGRSQVADDFQVVDGAVFAVAGSVCEQLLEDDRVRRAEEAAAPASGAEECDVKRRTFEVAVEAYFVQYGAAPLTEGDLVDSKMLVAEFADFDLGVDATIVVAPGSDCAG